jgi:uncharacterized protein DUF5317
MVVQQLQQTFAPQLVAGRPRNPFGSLGDHAADYARMRPRVLFATVAAATVGGLIGFARGGSLAQLAQIPIRWPWLAGLAWLVQVALFVSPLAPALQPWEIVIYLLSVVLLGMVILANRTLPGVALFGVGLLLNAATMAANGGYMPVSEAALRATGETANLEALQAGDRRQKAVLMRADSPLWFLGDVLPLPAIGKVYSVGDLVAAAGVLLIVAQGMQAARPGR